MADDSTAQRDYINPGPLDPCLLRLQASHRSEKIWQDEAGSSDVLRCRRESSISREDITDERLLRIVRQSGFYGLSQIGFFQLDHHLITALVERWRPETHTFHLPQGEATITLQDVAIQIGLPIDGSAVICPLDRQWDVECERLLGIRPPQNVMRGMYLNIKWLKDNFDLTHIPADADDTVIVRYARAYLLQLINMVLCSKSVGKLNVMYLPLLENITAIRTYSWGAACLAFLYKELCCATEADAQQISGALFLVQIWAWDRLKFMSPGLMQGNIVHDIPLGRRWSTRRTTTEIITHTLPNIRVKFDYADKDDFVWEPYTAQIREVLPNYCFEGQHLWRAVVPMICFHIVEWHQPDRVLRQFGLEQHIPRAPFQTDDLHSIRLKDIKNQIMEKQAKWISFWNDRARLVFMAQPADSLLHYHSQYMEWYRNVTRRWISIKGASYGACVDGLEKMALMDDAENMHKLRRSIYGALGEGRRYVMNEPPQVAPSARYPEINNDDEDEVVPPPTSTRRHRRREVPRHTASSCDPIPPPVTYHYQPSDSASQHQASFFTGPSVPNSYPYGASSSSSQQAGPSQYGMGFSPNPFSQWSTQTPWLAQPQNMFPFGSPQTPANMIFSQFVRPSSAEYCPGMSSFPSFHNEDIRQPPTESPHPAPSRPVRRQQPSRRGKRQN